MYNYRCEKCGCYLDPNEGRLCDECKAEEKIDVKTMLNTRNDDNNRTDNTSDSNS